MQSINASGHKYGLVYPGIGWALWRDAEALPEDLVFKVNYLGGEMPTFALNFSRPGSQVVVQYYNFLRLGREGYRAVQQGCQDVARRLSAGIAELDVADGQRIVEVQFLAASALQIGAFVRVGDTGLESVTSALSRRRSPS